jgi:hypothetical protein
MEEDMEQTHAGGHNAKTDSPFAGLAMARAPSRAESSLEDGLAEVASAVSALLAHAQKIDPLRDEYGHARSRAYDDAVNLLKASAKVGHTIAELRGSKFEHNINVRREDGAAASAAVPPTPDMRPPERFRLADGRLCVWSPIAGWRVVEEPERADSSAAVRAAAVEDEASTAEDNDAYEDENEGCLQYRGCYYDPDLTGPGGRHFVRGKGWMHVPDDWDEEAWRRAQDETGERGSPTPISEGSNGNFAGAKGAAEASGGNAASG